VNPSRPNTSTRTTLAHSQMKSRSLLALYLLTLASSLNAAPLITSLSRLDVDQTPGSSESVFSLSGAPFYPVYQDYSFTYSSWPSYLNGAEVVRMVNTDALDVDYRLQLTLAQPATVFLLVDDRTTTAAQPWVATRGFQDTGDTVMVWDFPYSVYSVEAPAGTFTLHENTGSLNMYTVAVVPEPSVTALVGAIAGIGLCGRRRRSNPETSSSTRRPQ
jgi:hypothetical protein